MHASDRRRRTALVAALACLVGTAAGLGTGSSALARTSPEQLYRPQAAVTAAATPARSGTWRSEAIPNPVTDGGALAATACAGPQRCFAVGNAPSDSGLMVPIAERWTPAGWSPEHIGRPAGAVSTVLTGVACSGATCLAVGYYTDGSGIIRTTAELRGTSGWQPLQVPDPGNDLGSGLFAVDCSAATSCLAVGTDNQPDGTAQAIALQWDGTSWQVLTTAGAPGVVAAQLSGISCVDGDSCTATGSGLHSNGTQSTLVERWAHGAWTLETSPDAPGTVQDDLAAVWCGTAGLCLAVGFASDSIGNTAPLAEKRDATGTWQLVAVPLPPGASFGELSAVSCTTATSCRAAGVTDAGPLVLRTAAGTWTAEATHLPHTTVLDGIVCGLDTACVTVGYHADGALAVPAAAVRIDDAWRASEPVHYPAAQASNLLGISCASPSACTAVGYTTREDQVTVMLVERWDGTAWSVQATPRPRGAPNGLLRAVSCPSARSCTAVGYMTTNGHLDLPVLMRWNGVSWATVRITGPAGAAHGAHLNAITCNSWECTAVGTYFDADYTNRAFVERIVGSIAHVQTFPALASGAGSDLFAVACPSATSCTAVGDRNAASLQPLVLTSSHGRWEVVPVGTPNAAAATQLDALSCPTATSCTAAGWYLARRNGVQHALVYQQTSHGWTHRPMADEPNAVITQPQSIDCTVAGACVAVGYYADLGSDGRLLPPVAFAASTQNATQGAPWRVDYVAVPDGTHGSVLNGASCAAGRCQAIGYRFAVSGQQITFAARR